MTTALSKELHPNSPRARQMVVDLINTHNKGDLYPILRESCRLIGKYAKSLSLSSTLPNGKVLVVSISNVIFAAKRLCHVELNDLANFFRGRFGAKFFDWTGHSGGNIVDERIVKKLGQPVQASLIDRYLHEIFKPSITQPPAPQTKFVKSQPREAGNKLRLTTPSQPKEPQRSEPSISISKLAPILPIRIIRPNPRLEIAFDVRTKNPVYCMERLDGTTRSRPVQRPAFFEEKRLLPEYRSRLFSFLCSGYDRGHLAPAADFGPDSVKDTFNLCNVSPQNHNMNRSIWVQLEHWCRQVARKELDGRSTKSCVYVVTGPIWLPNTSGTNASMKNRGSHVFEFAAIGHGDSLIHVPTHFFKVVAVVVDHSRIEKFACFLVPNLKPRPEALLEDYIVSWDRLEAITGLQFFPHLVDQTWKVQATELMCTLMAVSACRD